MELNFRLRGRTNEGTIRWSNQSADPLARSRDRRVRASKCVRPRARRRWTTDKAQRATASKMRRSKCCMAAVADRGADRSDNAYSPNALPKNGGGRMDRYSLKFTKSQHGFFALCQHLPRLDRKYALYAPSGRPRPCLRPL